MRAEVYAARSAEQVSSMARNILGHAAHASRQGKRDLAGDYDGCSAAQTGGGTSVITPCASRASICSSVQPSSRRMSRLSAPSAGVGRIVTGVLAKWTGQPG